MWLALADPLRYSLNHFPVILDGTQERLASIPLGGLLSGSVVIMMDTIIY